ncbi:MAG: phosphatase PAP2 family protein [Patescibacteria group bacterium]|jgi:undecaprenyl-diphosphatase
MFHPGPWPIDLSVSNAIQSFQPAWLTKIVKIISFIVAPEFYSWIILIAVIWLWHKNFKHQSWTIGALALGNASIPFLKWLFQRPRPSSTLVYVYQDIGLSSFPSGHAIAIVILLAILYVVVRDVCNKKIHPWVIIGGIVLGIFVGYCRIYIGVHWITDVMAGYIFGLLWVWAVFGIEKKLQ